MSSAPVRGIVPHRQRRHHHHHEKHRHHSDHSQDKVDNHLSIEQSIQSTVKSTDGSKKEETEEKRPKVNPIFLWAAQREQRIVEVRCEDYDKRNRIKLTKTAQGWRSIPRTALTAYSTVGSVTEDENEQETLLTTTSKNEEKENTSKKYLEIKQAGANEFENTRVNDANLFVKVDETREEKEKHKRKRKKHSDFPKNKKRKIESEVEEDCSETLITTNWKMKKRRKVYKNKKRKRMCIEKEIVDKNKVNNVNEIKIKEESKKEVETIDALKKTENTDAVEEEQKKCINDIEKTIFYDDKKSSDLEKLQKNRYLQPRVVLEQLHLSKLPIKIHRRLINKAEEFKNNAEQNEGNNENNLNANVEDNTENNNYNINEIHTDPENEEAVVNKEDLQEILNMLDSNHFPINVNGTKSPLIAAKNLSRKCTKLCTAVLKTDHSNDDKLDSTLKECAKNNELETPEKRPKIAEKNNSKHRVGSKSLDETIERLEKSIVYQKKINNIPNLMAVNEFESNKQKINKVESKQNETDNNCQNKTILQSLMPSIRGDVNEKEDIERNMIESSKILSALRNTPGLSVSLATNGRKHNSFINTISAAKKTSPSSRSPDSQTEVAERIGKSLPGISIVIPPYHNRTKTISPISKNRVESPESTVNFPKHERFLCEESSNEIDGHEDYDSPIADETRNSDNLKKHSGKCIHRNQEECQNYFEDEGKNYLIESSKIPNLKPLIPVVSRNSEAQAKYSGLSRYQDVDNFDEQMIEEFQSQVSPQPSGIPYTISSSRRSSSTYLERLLPSPPCSVSCSEDAKNDLTLKGILSFPNNVDSRNQDNKKDEVSDLNAHCDTEMSSSCNFSEERFLNESSNCDKSFLNHRSERYVQDKAKYLEMRSHGRPMSSGDVHSPFATDYVCPKRPLSAEWTVNQQRMQIASGCYSNNIRYTNQKEFINRTKVQETYMSPSIFLDPASQLRELIKTSGHLIPDPLLVPRDYLPLLAGAPLTEIPKLLATRPELRLPEALSRPELLRDPDLLVISLAHLQHVLDHGEGHQSSKIHQPGQPMLSPMNESKNIEQMQEEQSDQQRPKLSCKPIGKLMPAPIDLSSNHKLNSQPPLLRVRSGLLKQEPEVSSTANSPDDSQLWHPLFGSQKQRQQQHQQQQQQQQQQPQQHQTSWHRTTLAS